MAFGQSVNQNLIKQIQAREAVFGKDYKSAEDLLFTTANAPWIILRSGVDTPVPGTNGGKVSASDAKRCILVGGRALLSEDGKHLNKRAGITTDFPAYAKSETQGWRPMPGITGISVKPKDTWGIIMEAEISIQVWSREDLELVDKLFFKPGMVALLEWGHSVWVNNKGEIQETTIDTILGSEDFFTPQDYSKLDQQVRDRKSKFDGNYEACFGYITNFSYTFNDKGGWDCTVKMLSKSTVLEGLQIPKSQGEGSNDDTSEYHRLFKTMIEEGVNLASNHKDAVEKSHWKIYCGSDDFKKLCDGTRPSGMEAWNERAFKGRYVLHDCQVTLYTKTVRLWNYVFISSLFNHDKVYTMVYLSLADLLLLIQAINNVRDEPFPARGLVQFDLSSHNRYNSFEGHTSLNPYIAALPRQEETAWQRALGYGYNEQGKGYLINPATHAAHGYDETNGWVSVHNEPGDCEILNILVSANHFLDLVDREVGNNTEDFSILDVVNALLKDVQKALGNVNDFSLQYDSEKDLWSVVDHNFVNREKKQKEDGEEEENITIKISGPNTTVQKLSVNSAVSPSIANEMAIAAQAPVRDDTSTESSPNIIFWNEGCVNRHKISSKVENNASGNSSEPIDKEEWIREAGVYFNKEQYDKFKSKLAEIYRMFNSDKSIEDKDAVISDTSYGIYNDLQLPGESLYKRLINKEIKSFGEVGKVSPKQGAGVLPIKLELDMLGVGGFVVGTTFAVSQGILLDKYNSWGYIVTGIEHKVSSNGWSTHIKTQYYPQLNKINYRKCYGKAIRDDEEALAHPTSYSPSSDLPDPEEIIDRPPYFWRDLDINTRHKYLGTSPTMQPEEVWNRGLIKTIYVPTLNGDLELQINKALESDVISIFEEIKALGNFKVFGRLSGYRAYNEYRSSGKVSKHCWGAAIDVNGGNNANPWFTIGIKKTDPEPAIGAKGPYNNPEGLCKKYSSPPGGYNPTKCLWYSNHPVVKIFKRHGWRWGGEFRTDGADTMHFDLFK